MWVEPPADNYPFPLAEFIEMELFISGDPRLTLSEIRDSYLPGAYPTEEEFEFAFQEVEFRAARLGPHYPFARDNDSVRLREDADPTLYACLTLLALRNTPFRVDGEYTRSDPVFDIIVREAV